MDAGTNETGAETRPAGGSPAPPPADADRRGEDSGAPVRGAPAALRIGLIALLLVAAGGFGLFESRFLPRPRALDKVLGARSPSAPRPPADFPALPEDVFLSREPVEINGREVDSLRFASDLKPEHLVEVYAGRLRSWGYEPVRDVRALEGLGDGRFVRFSAAGQSMLGLKAPDGGFLGILAFGNSETGGSDYFVIREGPREREDGIGIAAGGRDPPGVEPPPASVREYCVERKGAMPSFLVLYRSQVSAEAVERNYRDRMPRAGWSEPEGAAEAFDGAPGGTHLWFCRGAEHCLVNVAPSADVEGECWVTVMVRGRKR